MRSLLFFAMMATLATVALSRSGFWGHRESGDTLIYSKDIQVSAKTDKIVTKKVSYDPWFSRPRITAVVVTDNFKDSYGAEPTLLRGGVGQKYVNILLTGQMSKGIDSTVKIYGKK
uniref:Salivary secreted peptide n=1 Tax=Stomoxys calcitrans TaxID=35570 RepID=A0A1I8Q7L7_STOCA